MPVKLVNPLKVKASVDSTPKKETARVANDHLNMCPECGKPMEETIAGGIPSLVCFAHNIAFPRHDSLN